MSRLEAVTVEDVIVEDVIDSAATERSEVYAETAQNAPPASEETVGEGTTKER